VPLSLLPRESLVRTGPVDHADWNYRPLLGLVSRSRFALALSLLPVGMASVLELGYGSGIFLPALATRARTVAGIDVHTETAAVARALASHGIAADLRTGDGIHLPFDTGAFDAVVAISALEFVTEIDVVCDEVRRVLRPGGSFVVVTPGQAPLLDFALRVATGENARDDFGDRRSLVEPALRRHFEIVRVRSWPPVLSAIVPIYKALLARNRA
jgi:ubiquinone/menaquinone biosynthesis C-methylase UbiE